MEAALSRNVVVKQSRENDTWRTEKDNKEFYMFSLRNFTNQLAGVLLLSLDRNHG
jgi:hypothetical protein